MPIKKSSIKDLKKSQKRYQRNLILKNILKKADKKILSLIANNDIEKLKTEYKNFASKVDKAAAKGIIHKNKASRKKSRILKIINKMIKHTGNSPSVLSPK